MKRTIEIRMAEEFLGMLGREEIKTSWTMAEEYGLERVLEATFGENLDSEEVDMATHGNYGVLEGFLYEGFYYGEIHVNRAYIHENNDLVLLGEGENMLIIKNDSICVCMFNQF